MVKKKNKLHIDIKYKFTSSYCTNTQVAICTGPLYSPSLYKYTGTQGNQECIEKHTCTQTE